MPTIGNKLQCGVNIVTHCMVKRMNDGCRKSPLKPQGQGSTITKTQGVILVRVGDTPVVLSHNERTKDEHGNDCVQ
jgi:hypothetical protein